MVSLSSLWLPILLSAIFVFIASSIIHMALKYHQTDFTKLPDERGFMDAVRPFAVPPGDYVVPHAGSMEVMNSPEFKDKAKRGPVIFMTVLPNGVPGMGACLVQWFLYSLVVSVFCAYLAGQTVDVGGEYLTVFRIVGTVGFAAYALGLFQNSIWYKRNWMATSKSVFDGLVYGLITAGTFGWLWPV